MRRDHQENPSGPVVVEVIGSPGTGKSTLASHLCALRDDIVPVSIYFTQPRNLKLLIPTCLSRRSLLKEREGGKRRPLKEILWMMRLEILGAALRREALKGAGVVVLDQGATYALARLRARKRFEDRSPAFQCWWEDRMRVIARILDVVVILDTSEEVALERIRTRSKPHRLKAVPEGKARRELAKDRVLYSELGADLSRRDLHILRFATDRQSAGSIAAEVFDFLALMTAPDVSPASAEGSQGPVSTA